MNFQKQPWKHDPLSKNFSHERFFGSVANLPKSLNRPKIRPQDQKGTLRCTGYGSAHNGEFIEGRKMHPDWHAAKIGQIQGRSVDINGADPNACMKSMRDYGFLPYEFGIHSLEKDGVEGSGWDKWPSGLDGNAIDRIPGFVRVDGPFDHFDNIRNALYQAYDPKVKRGACVDAFGRWFGEWTYAHVIPKQYSSFAGYHRYLFVDWLVDGTNEYLVACNSYGTEIGIGGYHYFPREVVNREFSQNGTSLKILKVLTAEQIAEAKKMTPIGQLWRAIVQAWYAISEIYAR